MAHKIMWSKNEILDLIEEYAPSKKYYLHTAHFSKTDALPYKQVQVMWIDTRSDNIVSYSELTRKHCWAVGAFSYMVTSANNKSIVYAQGYVTTSGSIPNLISYSTGSDTWGSGSLVISDCTLIDQYTSELK